MIKSIRAITELWVPVHHVLHGRDCTAAPRFVRGAKSPYHGLGEPKTVVDVTYHDTRATETVSLTYFKRHAVEVVSTTGQKPAGLR